MPGKWKKSSPELLEAFNRALNDFPDAERRQMFGYPCAFVKGHMVTGLHEENWLVRLGPKEREQLLSEGGVPFAPMGRVMKEYVVLPPKVRGKTENLNPWLEKTFAYVRCLPPKKPRKGTGQRMTKSE